MADGTGAAGATVILFAVVADQAVRISRAGLPAGERELVGFTAVAGDTTKAGVGKDAIGTHGATAQNDPSGVSKGTRGTRALNDFLISGHRRSFSLNLDEVRSKAK